MTERKQENDIMGKKQKHVHGLMPGTAVPEVEAVFPLEDLWLIVFFANGEIRLYDSMWVLRVPSMSKLEKPAFFKKAHACHKGVKWSKKIRIGAEDLYNNSAPLTDHDGKLLKLL